MRYTFWTEGTLFWKNILHKILHSLKCKIRNKLSTLHILPRKVPLEASSCVFASYGNMQCSKAQGKLNSNILLWCLNIFSKNCNWATGPNYLSTTLPCLRTTPNCFFFFFRIENLQAKLLRLSTETPLLLKLEKNSRKFIWLLSSRFILLISEKEGVKATSWS